MIRFLAGILIGALVGYAMAGLDYLRAVEPNVVPLTDEEQMSLRTLLLAAGREH